MPRLEDLVKPLTEMTYEEQVEKVRQIREGRVIPIERNKTKTARKREKKKKSLLDIVKDMGPEERAKFLEGLAKK